MRAVESGEGVRAQIDTMIARLDTAIVSAPPHRAGMARHYRRWLSGLRNLSGDMSYVAVMIGPNDRGPAIEHAIASCRADPAPNWICVNHRLMGPAFEGVAA